MGIVADGGGGDSEEDSGPTPFAVVVEVQDDRGGEIVGSLLRENNLFAAAEGVDGSIGGFPRRSPSAVTW